jgi:aspartate aminotransferase-like enzyme
VEYEERRCLNADGAMFVKARLMTPGPTQVAEATRLLMATSHPHHRSAGFTRLFVRMLGRLKWLWDTSGEVLFVTGSGTAGMEAAMQGALRPGDPCSLSQAASLRSVG